MGKTGIILICLLIVGFLVYNNLIIKDIHNSSFYPTDDTYKDKSQAQDSFYEKPKIRDYFPNITELHWRHMPILYRIDFHEYDSETIKSKTISIEEAMSVINKAIPFISFAEAGNRTEDILFLGELPAYASWDTEGMAEVNSSEGYIYSAIIYLPTFKKSSPDDYWVLQGSGGVCLETHEILHALGIGHSEVINGVMSPTSVGICSLEKQISSCLNKIYSNGYYNNSCENVNFIEENGVSY